MDDAEIRNLFEPLWAEVQGEDSFPNKRPLLAHYTSMTVLESILRNKEIWFSHPLLMNDPQEVTFWARCRGAAIRYERESQSCL